MRTMTRMRTRTETTKAVGRTTGRGGGDKDGAVEAENKADEVNEDGTAKRRRTGTMNMGRTRTGTMRPRRITAWATRARRKEEQHVTQIK